MKSKATVFLIESKVIILFDQVWENIQYFHTKGIFDGQNVWNYLWFTKFGKWANCL